MTSDREPTARTRRSEPFHSFQDRPPEVGPKREAVVASPAPSADVVSARSAKESQARRSEPTSVVGSESQARASRQNGARSRGPRTAAGKARSAGNAVKHGLRARKLVLLQDEDAAEFRRFARALEAELMPQGRLQADLVSRVAIAAWRARRADKLEAGVLGGYLEDAGRAGPASRAFPAAVGGTPRGEPGGRPGAPTDLGGRRAVERLAGGLVRDAHGARALATAVRYRGSVLAELFRSLAALKMLQAGAPGRRAAGSALPAAPAGTPNEPETTRQNSTLAEDGRRVISARA